MTVEASSPMYDFINSMYKSGFYMDEDIILFAKVGFITEEESALILQG